MDGIVQLALIHHGAYHPSILFACRPATPIIFQEQTSTSTQLVFLDFWSLGFLPLQHDVMSLSHFPLCCIVLHLHYLLSVYSLLGSTWSYTHTYTYYIHMSI